MVAKVDAEELSIDTDAIRRRVKDHSEIVDISQDGEIVARLIPAHGVSAEERDRRWAELKRFVEEVGKLDVGEVSAVEMVRDVRRDL
jgi:antitoxin (DNA-binding transcriptional repressor) of toxin-antitoxin stability system